jgi:hypothetical protein
VRTAGLSAFSAVQGEVDKQQMSDRKPIDPIDRYRLTRIIARPKQNLVRMKGLEPSLPCGNQNLNLARLPVSPHPRGSAGIITAHGKKIAEAMLI